MANNEKLHFVPWDQAVTKLMSGKILIEQIDEGNGFSTIIFYRHNKTLKCFEERSHFPPFNYDLSKLTEWTKTNLIINPELKLTELG